MYETWFMKCFIKHVPLYIKRLKNHEMLKLQFNQNLGSLRAIYWIARNK